MFFAEYNAKINGDILVFWTYLRKNSREKFASFQIPCYFKRYGTRQNDNKNYGRAAGGFQHRPAERP